MHTLLAIASSLTLFQSLGLPQLSWIFFSFYWSLLLDCNSLSQATSRVLGIQPHIYASVLSAFNPWNSSGTSAPRQAKKEILALISSSHRAEGIWFFMFYQMKGAGLDETGNPKCTFIQSFFLEDTLHAKLTYIITHSHNTWIGQKELKPVPSVSTEIFYLIFIKCRCCHAI